MFSKTAVIFLVALALPSCVVSMVPYRFAREAPPPTQPDTTTKTATTTAGVSITTTTAEPNATTEVSVNESSIAFKHHHPDHHDNVSDITTENITNAANQTQDNTPSKSTESSSKVPEDIKKENKVVVDATTVAATDISTSTPTITTQHIIETNISSSSSGTSPISLRKV